jgi:CHASE3 domain sensor protein
MIHARVSMLVKKILLLVEDKLPEQEKMKHRLTAMKTEEIWVRYTLFLIIIIIIIVVVVVIIVLRMIRKSF